MSASCWECADGAGEAEGEREMERMRSSKHGSVVGARDIWPEYDARVFQGSGCLGGCARVSSSVLCMALVCCSTYIGNPMHDAGDEEYGWVGNSRQTCKLSVPGG